jgi:hypothetical protein
MCTFVDVFWLLGVIFLAAVPLVFLMKRVEPREGGVVVE